SEDWCSAPPPNAQQHRFEITDPPFNTRGNVDVIVDARLRAKANVHSKATKILIYGYPAWSHGRVYYDLCKHLHNKRYIVDIINWQVDHAAYIDELNSYYDLFI